jgi:hypothetical protein
MKVAIFISGQPRLIDKSLLNHLDKQKIKYDVYIHYWENFKTYSRNTCGTINLSNNKLLNNPNLKEILIKYYKPKKIKCEKEPELNFTNRYDNCTDPNVNKKIPELCALGVKKCFELCDNVNDYDWLIKSRFDLVFPIIPKPLLGNGKKARTGMPYIYTVSERKNYLNNNLKIDFSNCNSDKINFTDLYDPGQPVSEFWVVKPKNKIIFNYYDYLDKCGNHPANEPIIGKFCKYFNIEMHPMEIRIGINRMYNNSDYLHD